MNEGENKLPKYYFICLYTCWQRHLTEKISKEMRSKIMASIRSKNTQPEIIIRRLLWSSGVRYRIHDTSVIGTPDISVRNKKVAIFLDGCFWHVCPECYTEPKSNIEFWRNKAERNRARRTKILELLAQEHWTVLQFWEHEIIKQPNKVASSILSYVQGKNR